MNNCQCRLPYLCRRSNPVKYLYPQTIEIATVRIKPRVWVGCDPSKLKELLNVVTNNFVINWLTA